LTPETIVPEVYEYDSSTMVPGIFCAHCEDYITTIYNKLTEEQKLAIDVWVSRNINESFISSAIMERIQKFKKLRIDE
jgi:hypothetical protein